MRQLMYRSMQQHEQEQKQKDQQRQPGTRMIHEITPLIMTRAACRNRTLHDIGYREVVSNRALGISLRYQMPAALASARNPPANAAGFANRDADWRSHASGSSLRESVSIGKWYGTHRECADRIGR
jgi:hypothetical protein